MTLTHTPPRSPGCLCNPSTSCLLCLPVLHDQFILPGCVFPSSPLTPLLLLSVLSRCVAALSVFAFLTHSAHLTPYFSLVCPPLPPANPFTPLLASDHPLPHYLSGCSPLLPLAASSSPFYTFISCHPPPAGFFTLPFHLAFYSFPQCLCFDPLSPLILKTF